MVASTVGWNGWRRVGVSVAGNGVVANVLVEIVAWCLAFHCNVMANCCFLLLKIVVVIIGVATVSNKHIHKSKHILCHQRNSYMRVRFARSAAPLHYLPPLAVAARTHDLLGTFRSVYVRDCTILQLLLLLQA